MHSRWRCRVFPSVNFFLTALPILALGAFLSGLIHGHHQQPCMTRTRTGVRISKPAASQSPPSLERLISAQTSHETGSRILSFGYDATGNLTSKTSTVAGDAEVTGYQYTGLHRLNSALIDGVSTTFDYDAAGNISRYNAASGADTLLAYDARGQLESITVGSTEDAFHYGPDGARYLKESSWVEDSTAQTAWTLYLVGGAYEETYPVGDAEVLVRQQVQVSRTVIHRRTVTPIFTATERIEYRHRDHLPDPRIRVWERPSGRDWAE